MMLSTDPIADMLTRIRNALNVQKTTVSVPHSKTKESIVQILKQHGYVESIDVDKAGPGKIMVLGLSPSVTIHEIARVSKPGRRVYAKVKDIPTVKQGRGIVVVSTSQGIMSGHEAQDKKLGGEVLCQVY